MQREFNVPIPKGYFMSWFVTTQAAFKITVTLKDSSKEYFSESKQSTNIDPPLACSYSTVFGDNLKITVNIPQSSQILGGSHSNDITEPLLAKNLICVLNIPATRITMMLLSAL